MKCIAVDWSGAKDKGIQRKHLWLAEAIGGELVRLEGGHIREEVVDRLVAEIQSREQVAVGLDFAFSFPEWYLHDRGLRSARELWELAALEGETWLSGESWPFWGRAGEYRKKPDNLAGREFRQTDMDVKGRGFSLKEPFQVLGPGTVGTGTVRGLPFLAQLQNAGAAIWPFDNPVPGKPVVVEIYPRLLTGELVKSNAGRRADYLIRNHSGIDTKWRRLMEERDDALDAGVSALVMSANAANLRRLQPDTASPYSLEGCIWTP